MLLLISQNPQMVKSATIKTLGLGVSLSCLRALYIHVGKDNIRYLAIINFCVMFLRRAAIHHQHCGDSSYQAAFLHSLFSLLTAAVCCHYQEMEIFLGLSSLLFGFHPHPLFGENADKSYFLVPNSKALSLFEANKRALHLESIYCDFFLSR